MGNAIKLSGAIRRATSAAALTMADGNAYGVTLQLPADMRPKARRILPVRIFPKDDGGTPKRTTTIGSVAGYVDLSNEWNEMRVATVVGGTILAPGLSRIVFDGAEYFLTQ